jgi:NAD(P)-dependent dehydrogenase (short-subunit alcohol dehydrogenase family)
VTEISFAGRVAIVTGAGNGLGRTYAMDIARRGGSVVVNDLGVTVEGFEGSSEAADAVVAEIRSAGGTAVANYDSVAAREGAAQMVATALDHFGRVDALISNAGILRNSLFEEIPVEDWDAHLATHLTGAFNVAQAVWPHMQAQRYGRVVFATSAAGMLGNATQACYGSAKAGMTGLMNVLSQEGEPYGILCNALQPNAKGRMGARMTKDRDPAAAEKAAAILDALKASMEPEFNTGLAVYLASEACTTTHSIYSSLGGRFARVFIGVTEGWQGSREQPSTAEDVAAHIDQIRDTGSGYYIPENLRDEFPPVLSATVEAG